MVAQTIGGNLKILGECRNHLTADDIPRIISIEKEE